MLITLALITLAVTITRGSAARVISEVISFRVLITSAGEYLITLANVVVPRT
jgi:hypothetical protein